MKNFKDGIDKVYKSLVTESEVPDVTTDDFVMFLQWMAKRTNEDGDALYTPLNIADVVAEPHHYSKEFTEYQSWRESEFGNHILHPNEDVVDEHGSRSSDRFNSKNAYRSAKGTEHQASLKRQALAKRRMKADKNKPKVPTTHSAYRLPEGIDGPSGTDNEVAQGEFQEVDKDGDGEAETLIVTIPDMDVEDSISTADRSGAPRPGNYIRIRAQLERLLRDKLGFDIFMGGTPDGKYTLKIYWSDKTGYDKNYFKIVPR